MSISYEIHFTSGAASLTGNSARVTHDLSIDSSGKIKWADAQGNLETVDRIEFTYNGTDTTAISISMSCTASAYFGPLAYNDLNEDARATRGGMTWSNSGSVMHVSITPPDPPPPVSGQLPSDCSKYPKVYWKDVSGAPPTKLHVKIKRQKDTVTPCAW